MSAVMRDHQTSPRELLVAGLTERVAAGRPAKSL